MGTWNTFTESDEDEVKKYREAFNSFIGEVSPMNTEMCKQHMSKVLGKDVANEDVLHFFYH